MLQNQSNTREQYITSTILTATPQKLHLMMLEGAIRFGLLANKFWDQPEKSVEKNDALMRMVEIVGELVAGLRSSTEPLAKQIIPVYAFILKSISEAAFDKSLEKLQDGLRVLEVERETWSKVCETFGETEPQSGTTQQSEPTAIPIQTTPDHPLGGFSFQA